MSEMQTKRQSEDAYETSKNWNGDPRRCYLKLTHTGTRYEAVDSPTPCIERKTPLARRVKTLRWTSRQWELQVEYILVIYQQKSGYEKVMSHLE